MEQKRAGWHKRLAAVIIVLFAVVAIVTGISLFSESRKNVYQNDYYSIELPEGWMVEVKTEKQGYQSVRLMSANENHATEIWVAEKFKHRGTGVSGVRAEYDFLGMHGHIKSEKIVVSDSGMPFYRVVVEFEPSAAMAANGEADPDVLHYMYIGDDDLFISVEVRDNTLWDEVEEIVKTMKLLDR